MVERASAGDFVPVNLLTGFLGAGKTTLLRRLLADPSLSDAAVLINEFGEVGLDHHLLERIDDDVVLLPSGCVCCTVRGELAESLRDLWSRRALGRVPAFSRVIVESTGLADPFPILSTLQADPVLRHHFRAGRVVTVVDAVNGGAQLDAHVESVRQAAAADRIVLTKTGLAGSELRARLSARLDAINPLAPRSLAEDDPIEADALLGRELHDASRGLGHGPRWLASEFGTPRPAEDDPDGAAGAYLGRATRAGPALAAHPGVRAISLVRDAPLDWTRFGLWLTMLVHRHGDRLLRIKGILDVSGSPTPVVVHGVRHLVHPPVHLAAWPSDDRRSVLVVIADGLEAGALGRSLDAFVGSRPPEATAA